MRTTVAATIIPLPTSPITGSGSSCGPDVITLTASGGVNGQYRWYTVATGGTSITGELNGIYTTPSIATTTSYFVAINNGICESNRTAVSAIITPLPIAPVATAGNSCGPDAIILTAIGGTNGQYRWCTVVSGGTSISGEVNSTYVTPSISVNTTYFATINIGGCESTRTAVNAIINTLPAAPTTSAGSSCGTGSVTLSASGGTNSQYRWYTNASGGSAISGSVNNTYLTPSLSTTTNYYVAVNNGTCESTRTLVTATINLLPSPPVGISGSSCAPSSAVLLNAAGGSNGQYRWYTTSSGGAPIAGETNNSYTTPLIATSTTFYVSIYNGACESVRTSVLAQIISCTPKIAATTISTQVGGQTSLDVAPLVSTFSNPIDINSIKVIKQPLSGASAKVSSGVLKVNYAGITFAGTDKLTIEACDLAAHSAQQEITIEVAGDITVYNALSPNGDSKNEIFYIQSIDLIPETKDNKVIIFDRWGSIVFEVDDYDNVNRVFRGISSGGNDLPSGTYFYKIDFNSGHETKTGFISLRR